MKIAALVMVAIGLDATTGYLMAMNRTGFIGLGTMGYPMALNLAKAGVDLIVWNRTPKQFSHNNVRVAQSVSEVFANSDIVFLMLSGAKAIDQIVDAVLPLLQQKIVVNTGTTTAAHSKILEKKIANAGGFFVEAPVSGSRKPAENAELIVMTAGDPGLIQRVTPLLSCLGKKVHYCGPIPNALYTKFAANIFMINAVTGLAESLSFARSKGLNVRDFVSLLDISQMASDISRIKSKKFVENDFSRQAAIRDVLENCSLIVEEAAVSGVSTPLMNHCHALYNTAHAAGLGDQDMIAVTQIFNRH